eukprot:575836-Prorocentrum_minimum.AAC.1
MLPPLSALTLLTFTQTSHARVLLELHGRTYYFPRGFAATPPDVKRTPCAPLALPKGSPAGARMRHNLSYISLTPPVTSPSFCPISPLAPP